VAIETRRRDLSFADAEEEWEYAARNGDKDNLYPWATPGRPDARLLRNQGVGATQPVGTYAQGIDRWGVEDLVGNVWEWTSSKGLALQKVTQGSFRASTRIGS